MRAFLAAGAASLLLTLWPVEDASAAALMGAFYDATARGERRAEALRQAQRTLAREDDDGRGHPYFWAPFYLVGDSGPMATFDGENGTTVSFS
jgi:CHAT domain-containing protein